jgi:cytochrome c oxidase assembly protein subunit 15
MALVVYGLLIRAALDHLVEQAHDPGARGRRVERAAFGGALLVLVTAGAGALVAGLHAGFVSSTFPLMQGQVIPEGMWVLEPKLRNLFENPLTVQFQHRLVATLTGLSVAALWVQGLRAQLSPYKAWALHACLIVVIAQYLLGVMTVVYFVPKLLAALHQAGAAVLFSCLIVVAHRQRLEPDYDSPLRRRN